MKSAVNAIDEIACGCLAARVRVIGRTVTAIYDEAVSRHGMTIAQVNLLAAMGWIGPCSPTKLGDALQLERSTVSRNLDLLLKQRWARATASDAKGVREVKLSASGEKKLQSVLPDWRKAQSEATRLLGKPGAQAIRNIAERVWTHAPKQA